MHPVCGSAEALHSEVCRCRNGNGPRLPRHLPLQHPKQRVGRRTVKVSRPWNPESDGFPTDQTPPFGQSGADREAQEELVALFAAVPKQFRAYAHWLLRTELGWRHLAELSKGEAEKVIGK